MSEINYEKLGFKSGLEIHQQLDSHKLFCNCPSILRKDEPDFVVKRKLHLVAGESGEIDVAVKHEVEKNEEFVYQGYDTTCLVELDEEPPHEINEEALQTAVHISLLLNAKIFPITQIMRKTVVDGSNTSGFQRTVMIAYDGFVETSFGRVGIDSVFLEEDSARPVSGDDEDVESRKVKKFKLDRLGIPLVEIATKPDIKNAAQAKECALKIGEILRSCKVRRGIGTIRQDINISINGSNRVELKGFQDPKIIIKTIENEVLRQKKFVDDNKENPSEVRNCLPDGTTEFLRPMPGSARMYPETDLPLLKISKDFINSAKKNLPKLKSVIEEELRKKGLSQERIKILFKQNKLEKLKELLEIYDNAEFVSKMILIFAKEIATKTNKALEQVDDFLDDFYGDVLNLVNNKKISEGDVKGILIKLIQGENFEDAIKVEKVDSGEIEEKILRIIKEKPGLNANAYMGLVMKEFKGNVDGKVAREIIERLLK